MPKHNSYYSGNNQKKFNNGYNRQYNSNSNGVFINPYSFMPIDKPIKDRKEKEKGNLSGYIDFDIEIKSPVFIPNTSNKYTEKVEIITKDNWGKENKRTEEHSKSVFYSYCDLKNVAYKDAVHPENPVIPGSEIRGMIRNVYEQLTNSCFVHTDENNLPFKRTPEPKVMCIMKWDEGSNCWRLYTNISNCCVSGALIKENGGYKLIKSWKGRTDIKEQYKNICNDFKYGEKYTVDYDNSTGDVKINQSGNWYVHIPPMMKGRVIGTDIPTANKQILYNVDLLNNGIVVSKDTLKRFEYVLGDDKDVKGGYTDKTFNKNSDSVKIYSNYLKRYKRKEPLIVYVDENSIKNNFENDIIYLSPASMTKEFFGNKIPDILQNQGEHQKCTNIKNACPACRLFGMIGEKGAIRGKLRFLDANAKNYEYGDEMTLPILGTPKISATEFYLLPPSGLAANNNGYNGTWNYDYFTTYSKDAEGNTIYNRTYIVPELSGRKVYWNRSGTPEYKAQKTKMNTTVTPIESGTFKSKIFFENLTTEELENLIFCLELQKGCNHKIGHGKPVGLGKVELKINEIKKCSYQLKNNTIEKTEEDYIKDTNLAGKIKSSNDAKLILEYTKDLTPEETKMVDYPKARKRDRNGQPVGEETVFQWFTNNRGSVNKPQIKQTLPKLEVNGNKKLKK